MADGVVVVVVVVVDGGGGGGGGWGLHWVVATTTVLVGVGEEVNLGAGQELNYVAVQNKKM